MAKDMSEVRPCAIADALDVIGERWTLLIVRELLFENRRFAGIATRTGAPSDILSARLKRLVDEGLLERRIYSEHPPLIEYFLTEKGAALVPVLMAIQEWGLVNARHDGPKPAMLPHGDHELDPVSHFTCRVCGGDALEPAPEPRAA